MIGFSYLGCFHVVIFLLISLSEVLHGVPFAEKVIEFCLIVLVFVLDYFLLLSIAPSVHLLGNLCSFFVLLSRFLSVVR